MSDPRYEHEFLPNRKGRCKQIIGFEHCGEDENFPPHIRWAERHQMVTMEEDEDIPEDEKEEE